MPRFQHTAARRRLDRASALSVLVRLFQHTAARRRLGICPPSSVSGCPLFQHTAARRRLARWSGCGRCMVKVSTHSRPKAAGTKKKATLSIRRFQHTAARRRLGGHQRRRGAYQSFNTQPPEGGWRQSRQQACADYRFNTQPPEGGWVSSLNAFAISVIVSTHSRPKAAGTSAPPISGGLGSFNTQPPEGGWRARAGLC